MPSLSKRPPKLILITGPVGAGKSTIAKRYCSEHPLALNIEADLLVAMHGQWLQHEDKARAQAFRFITVMANLHLNDGYDVVLPYFLSEPAQADELLKIARECGARFYEFAIMVDEPEATRRLFARGSWGEPDAPPLTQDDLPVIHELYCTLQSALSKRPDIIKITSLSGDTDAVYHAFVAHLG